MGTVVTVQTDKVRWTRPPTPDRSSANEIPTWLVVEGNDDFSGTFTGKVVALRKNAVVKLDPANFNAGSYTPGVLVTFGHRQVQAAAAAHDQIIGEVLRDDTAIDGTITIYYDGGSTAKV